MDKITTDETECDHWECDNRYTHCDITWNCPNGKDEINCLFQPPLNCSLNEHLCVSPIANQFICLPIEKANDGQIDCFGAYDEPRFCRILNYHSVHTFHCRNQTNSSCISLQQLCNNRKDCQYGDDEQFCTTDRTPFNDDSICSGRFVEKQSDIESFLCGGSGRQITRKVGYVATNKINLLHSNKTNYVKNPIVSRSLPLKLSNDYQPHCLRGLDLYVWSGDKKTLTCLCPPSYYGSQCQYQNQRISLTIRVRALSQSYQTLFAVIISLIDDSDQRIVHSFMQISYLSVRDCQNKYGFYLVYSTRPKDPTKTYSIHIDFYEKNTTLTYRGSLLYPIEFPFLPVHRLALLVYIPKKSDKTQSCSKDRCYHGKCIRYSNTLDETIFCQCEPGWSGRYCHIQFNCTCSLDSICIGKSANKQSICVCPINKFGSRCFLFDQTHSTNNSCQNGGQYIPNDNNARLQDKFTCICPAGFSGDQCQLNDSKIILSFNREIAKSESFFIHFMEYILVLGFIRSTTFQTIPVQQNLVTIYSSQPFHLVFIEFMKNNYYLIVNQQIHNQSAATEKLVKPSDRCPHINELLNETIAQLEPIRRIKYYQLPCQMYSPHLNCFYDEHHLCLCYNFSGKRLVDCMKFDHNRTFDCVGQNECENDGKCFQNDYACPSRSVCMCLPCYFGRRCQFSTSGFGLSLDTILGYHIFPNLDIGNQSTIIKFSLSLTIIFILIGLIDGIICLITFKNKTIREVGCGLYLLISSITTIFTMVVFGLKFFILLFTQMKSTSNESFLLFQCRSIDFILRICLSMDQWLNACVAIERTMVIIKGPKFSKKKSQKAAKFVTVILLIVISVSYIHDPIYRRLTDETDDDDDNQRRIWCIVSYPSNVEVYNYIIHIIHFFGPFSINLVSSIILIIKLSRQQSGVHKKRPYKEILKEQLDIHRHLLIAPIVLVILSIPRLIITFVSKCMKSSGDAWLYLIGYLISFIPSIMNSLVFIFPSELYRKEFHKSVVEQKTIIQRYLGLRT